MSLEARTREGAVAHAWIGRRHVGIIMDGNRRWARYRGLPSNVGHTWGERRLFQIVDAAVESGVEWLTVFAFSTENWNRAPAEVAAILGILESAVKAQMGRLNGMGVRVRWLGTPAGLPPELVEALRDAARLTESNSVMTLTICINHGGRQYIADACRELVASLARGEIEVQDISEELIASRTQWPDLPRLDVIIRTSGEKRLSNFLLWQLSETVVIFDTTLWPDFDSARFRRLLGRRLVARWS